MKKMLVSLVFALVASFCFAQNMDSLAVVREVDSLIQVSRALTDKRDFEKALEVNSTVEKLALEKQGRESAAYGSCCFNRGRVLHFKRDYPEAEKWYLESKAIREKALGMEHPDYAWSLNNLAGLYLAIGQYGKAELLYIESKNIREKAFGKDHPEYAASLNNLAAMYWYMGQFEKAEPLYLEAIDIRGRVLSKEHPEYAQSLNSLAVLYERIGRYEKAEPLFLEAMSIQEKTLGKEHLDYASSLNNLAILYESMGQYEKAEHLYLEAIAIKGKALGKEHPEYASSLNNLAIVYSLTSQYEKAEPLCKEAIAIWGKALGTEHPAYAQSLNNLAVLYWEMGQYEKAEPLHIEAKTIREKTLGKEHPDYATSLSNLAALYVDMSQHEKAEPLFLESKTIREKTLGKEHPDYAQSLSNLAALYVDMGQYEKAEPLYFESKTIQEKTLGKEHRDYTQSLHNLANLYWFMGQYEKAQSLYLEAKVIREKTLGKEHPDYAKNLNNLAVLYWEMGQYEKTEPLHIEAKAIREKVLGKEHPDYAQSLGNLANLYGGVGQYEKAEPLYVEYSASNQALLERAARHLSERELGSYLNRFLVGQNQTLSFTQRIGGKKGLPVCYDNSLFYKGFLLHAADQIKRLSLWDSVAAEKINLLKSYGRRLAAEYSLPIAERDSTNVAELEEKANTLEKELVRSVAGFGEALRQVNWQEVRDKLHSNEVAIEFVHFQYYNQKGELTDSILYAALLLRPAWPQPRMVGLFEEKAIQPLLNAANNTQLYAARGDKKRGQTEKGEGIVVGIGETASLYQLIWQPLDSLLNAPSIGGGRGEAVKTVYCSPSGLLHRLNLGAIPVPSSDQVLADRYKLVQLGSTRQLVVGSSSSSGSKTATLFGGLRFDSTTALDTATATVTATYDITSIRRSLGARGGDTWDYLPGTEKEIQSVGKTLTKSGYSTQTFTSNDGSEANFKSLGTNNAPSPAVLHIATHGFFFPDPKDTTRRNSPAFGGGWGEADPVFKTSDNPLMRSGLILSGANGAWAGGKTPEGQEDGILTAYEISQMNLSNTELVVLSACETGLGDVSGNEGVYGLQRAFKIAGAKYLIMSLWQVPDKQTSLLMTTFYKKWLEEKMEIPEAFRAAQKEMREQGFDPYQWAGFVLVE